MDAQYPDRKFFLYRERFVAHMLDRLAAELQVKDESSALRCLDMGCNTGRYTKMLRDRGLNAEGLDFSAEMLASARARCPGVTFTQGDAQNMPYEACTFDGIVSLGLIQMLPDWRKALAETVRVLKPGGTAVIETNRRYPAWEYAFKDTVYALTGTLSAAERRSVLNAHRLGPEAPGGALKKFSVRDLVNELEKIGGVSIEVHDPRKHGVFHDFVFAVVIHKLAGDRVVKIERSCR